MQLHIGVLIAFIAGIATLALFDHFAVPASEITNGGKFLFLIPAAVAAVMGIHGLGEGWNFASVAHIATSQSLTDAFGGLSALASYPMHKALEVTIIASLYTAYVRRNPVAVKNNWHIPVLGLLFGVPSVIGASIGYFVSLDTTYFFAFGVTGRFVCRTRLGEAVVSKSRDEAIPAYLGWKTFLAMLIGFLLLYTAALFH